MTLSNLETGHIAREAPSIDLDINKAQGSFLITSNGKRYIDFTMGWCVGNLGWNNPDILSHIQNFNGPIYVSPHFDYRPWKKLADLLASIAPGKLSKSFRATGGTEAVEIALQAAMKYTQRRKFVAIEGAYHGNSLAAKALVSSRPQLPLEVSHIKPPLDESAIKEVEEVLKNEDVAALIMEPIILNLGVLIPEQKFMQKLQELCRKHGTLLIMDEVASGFGRTGKLFACEHFGIEPDIMTLAKGFTSGHSAMGATMMTDEVACCMDFESSAYSTYGWHPLGVEAAIATIEYFKQHETLLFKNINFMSDYFQQRLCNMAFRSRRELRIRGLAIGVEFKDEDYASEITEKALKHGLIISEDEKGFNLFPALNIDLEVAVEGLDILESSI